MSGNVSIDLNKLKLIFQDLLPIIVSLLKNLLFILEFI